MRVCKIVSCGLLVGLTLALGDQLVGLTDALGDQLGGLSRRDAAAAATQQRGRQCKSRGDRIAFGETLRPSDHGLPDRVDEVRAAQLAFGAETCNDHRRRQRHQLFGIVAEIQEDLKRSRTCGVQTALQRCAHRTIEDTVDHLFGAGEAR